MFPLSYNKPGRLAIPSMVTWVVPAGPTQSLGPSDAKGFNFGGLTPAIHRRETDGFHRRETDDFHYAGGLMPPASMRNEHVEAC